MRGKSGRRVLWTTALCLVLLAAGTGGWQLLRQANATEPIVVGTTSQVTGLDPAAAYDSGSWALFSNVFQGLLTFEPGSATPVPDAAEKCGFLKDKPTVYRCTLRTGLKFSDGAEMTSHDVRHSIERVVNIEHAQGPAMLFDTLDSIRTRGPQIDFLLKSPDATFPLKLAGSAGAIVPSGSYPEKSLRTGNKMVGSGPFKLADYREKKHAELVPYDDYRGAQRTPTTPVTIRYFDAADKLSEAFEERRVDINDGAIPPAEIAELNPSDPEVDVTEHSGTDIQLAVFNMREGSVTAERPVREAIAAVLDRQRLARKVHKQTVEPLYSLIPQGMTGHGTPFFDRYPAPDVPTAKRLLEEADVSTPVRFGLAYADGATSRKEAAELKKQLESSGLFEVDLQGHEWGDYLAGLSEGKYDAYVLGWAADFPDPETYTGPLVTTGNALQNGYGDKKTDSMVKDVQHNPDRAQTLQAYREIHERIAEHIPVLPLWQKKDYVLTRPGIAGSQYLSDSSGVWRLWKLERL